MDIYYEINGQGFPVILLHGNQEDRRIFERLIDDLKDQYQLIAIDSRYHGKSIKSGELSLHQMALDVMHVADELSLEAYGLIGFSDGANIALTLGNMDERLTHMVLMSPNSKPTGIMTIYYIQMWLTLFCLLPFCLYDKKARRIFKLTRFMLKEPHFTAEELSAIKIPALLLWGEHDMIKKSDLQWIAGQLPHVMTYEVPQSNHFLLGDGYQDVLIKIRGFFYAIHNQ